MRHLVFAFALCLPTQGLADEAGRLHFSLGYDDILKKRTSTAAAGIEYAWPGFGRNRRYHVIVAAMATADIDLWVGAGLSWERSIRGGPWFVEASFAPGFFYRDKEAAGVDRFHFPMFRSQAAIGYEFDTKRSVSVALSHHSAASLDERAGSTETIWLRYGLRF